MQTILTRRFDELEIASDGFDENVDYSEFEEKMSVPKIKAAVQEILTMAAEISDTDYKLDALCSTIELQIKKLSIKSTLNRKSYRK